MWGDDTASEALLLGQPPSGDEAFDDVLVQLRAVATLPAPAPRNDVAALIEAGWAARVHPNRRWRLCAAAAAGALSVSLAGAAAASETVREPLRDTFTKVAD